VAWNTGKISFSKLESHLYTVHLFKLDVAGTTNSQPMKKFKIRSISKSCKSVMLVTVVASMGGSVSGIAISMGPFEFDAFG
jgi:hypothetical protein